MEQYYFAPYKRPDGETGVWIFSQKFYDKEGVISDQSSNTIGEDSNGDEILDSDFDIFADEADKKFGFSETCESHWTCGTLFEGPAAQDLVKMEAFVAYLDKHPNFKRNLAVLNPQDGDTEYVCSNLTTPNTTEQAVAAMQPEPEKAEKVETVEEKLARYAKEQAEAQAQIAQFELERNKILTKTDRKFDVSVELHAENERSQIKTFQIRGTYTDSKGRGKVDIDIHKDVNQDDLNAVLAWANEQLENLDTFTIEGPAYSIDSSFLQCFSIGRFCVDQLHAGALDTYINEFKSLRAGLKRPQSPCS